MWKIDIVLVIALFYEVIMMQRNLPIDFQFKFNRIKTKAIVVTATRRHAKLTESILEETVLMVF